jgi:hypothetical protein
VADTWHPDGDTTPTPREVQVMAEVLEGRHGVYAAEVAEFFSTMHSLRGDAGRCWAWAGVAETVRVRTEARMGTANRATGGSSTA